MKEFLISALKDEISYRHVWLMVTWNNTCETLILSFPQCYVKGDIVRFMCTGLKGDIKVGEACEGFRT